MPRLNVLELAKQGNAKAIAALMNRPLQAKGIKATINRFGNSLEVWLEGEQLPHQASLVRFVHKGLSNLEIDSINQVKVYGQRQGESNPGWVEEFELQSLPDFLEKPIPLNLPTGMGHSVNGNGATASKEEFAASTNGAEPYGAEASPELSETHDYDPPEATSNRKFAGSNLRLLGLAAIALLLSGGFLVYRYVLEPSGIVLPFLASETALEEVPPVESVEVPIADEASPEEETTPEAEASPDADAAPDDAASPDAETPTNAAATDDDAASPEPSPDADASPAAEASPSPAEASPSPTAPANEQFRLAVNKAVQAAELTQSARTEEEWELIADLWDQAANLMGDVPQDSPNYDVARDRIDLYQRNEAYARRRLREAANLY